jgi:methyl-accepting chemotaxis protein
VNQAAKQAESSALARTDELTMIYAALTALKRGDATARLPMQGTAAFTKVAEVFNDLVDQNVTMSDELQRLSKTVGKEGKLKKRASFSDARGFWGQSVDSVNALIDDLVHPVSEVGRVIGAVAQGDLSKSMALDVDGRALEGEFLRTAKTINKMVEQLGSFSAPKASSAARRR